MTSNVDMSHSYVFFFFFHFYASNGGLDPWRSGGVTESLSDSLIAILIPDGAHHLDLRFNNEYDPQSVLFTRKLEVMYFKKWIKQNTSAQ